MDIGIVLLSSVIFTSTMVTVTGPGALLERIPAPLMVVIAAWALYAGYRPIRWVWVMTNLGLAVMWVVPLIQGDEQLGWLAVPMAVGHGFVGFTLALSSSVHRFLTDRSTSREAGGPFEPAYTATLAFVGLLYLWCLGSVRELLGWQPDERSFTLLTIGTLGPLGVVYLAVAAMRSVGLSLARPVTTALSFLLVVQFPHGTAAFLYWWLKVRERERRAPPLDHLSSPAAPPRSR